MNDYSALIMCAENSQKHSEIRAGRDIIGNTSSIVGNNNTVIQVHKTTKKEEPLSLGPDSQKNGLIKLAKFVYDLLGPENYPKFFIGLIGLSSIALVGSFFMNLVDRIYPLIIGLIVLLFSAVMYHVPDKSTCPKCKKKFALFEENRELIKEKKLGNRIIENQRVFQQCKYCGHNEEYIDIIEKPVEA